MLNIDKYAYASKLNRIEPLQKFVFAVLTLGICLWADTLITSTVIFLLMSWLSIYKSGTPARDYFKLLLVPLSFLLIGVLTIAINFSADPQIFYLALPVGDSWLGLSKTGLVVALHLFFRVMGSVACLYFLSLSTPMVDLLSVLRRLKVPKLMVELMSLIYRFIFVLLETADTMFTAQSSRLGYVDLKTSYRSLGALASTLFVRAYKRSTDLYTSLESRGYDGDLNVLEEPFQKNHTLYWAAILVNSMLLFIALAIK